MSGEQQLWAAVLQNAIDDARGTVTGEGSRRASACETSRAREWLTKPNRDFNTVCYLAGLDPEAVRERVIARFAQRPGVGSDLGEVLGTGGGSTAQHISQMEFSE